MATISPPLKMTLYILAFVGFYGTWIRSALNGTLAIINGSIFVTGTLPDGQIPLETNLTGIYWPLDHLLDTLIVFFWQSVDGSHPATTLHGLYFAGQLLVLVVVLYVDSYKSSHPHSWKADPTLWLFIFQATAVATSGPWYVLYTLATTQSSESFTVSKADVESIKSIPLTVTIGYVLLIVGMAIPSTGPRAIVSPATQQVWVAIWNMFPLFTGLLQFVFQVKFLSSEDAAAYSKSTPANHVELFSALRYTYAFAIFCSSATHIAVLTTTFSTVLFPTLFSTSAIQQFNPVRIFSLPLSHAEVPSMGVGALHFLQWDMVVGFLTFVIPVMVNYRRTVSSSKENYWKLILRVVAGVLLFGPGATLVGLKWLCDEAALEEDIKSKDSSKRT